MSERPKLIWWRVVVAVSLFSLAAIIIADQFFEGVADYVLILALILLGLTFLWAFYARGIFWAVAPGVGLLAVAVAGIVSYFIEENNGWVATLILGAAAYIIGAIPNPRNEMKVTYPIGAMLLIIGFLLAPLSVPVTVVLCVVTILPTGYLIWRNREQFQQA